MKNHNADKTSFVTVQESYSGNTDGLVVSGNDPLMDRFGIASGVFTHRGNLDPIDNTEYHPVKLLTRVDYSDPEFEESKRLLDEVWASQPTDSRVFEPHQVVRRQKGRHLGPQPKPFILEQGELAGTTSLLKNAAKNAFVKFDNGVAVIARGLVGTPEGEDTGQWLLATPNRVAERFEGSNFKDVMKSTIDTPRKATAAIVLGAVVAHGAIENPDKPVGTIESEATRTELVFQQNDRGEVFTSFDTSNQDIALSEAAAQMAGGLPESSVRIDVITGQIHFSKKAAKMGEEHLVTAVIAASAPEVASDSEQAEQKNPEDMNNQEYMQYLADSAEVTLEEYNNFEINTDYEDVFKDELSGNRIKPTKFVAHWTAVNYSRGVEGFIDGIKGRKGNCCSSMYFIPQDGSTTYRFADSWEQMAHAYGANTFTQGVEIEAEGMRDLKPEQMKQLVMVAKRFMDANDIAITRDNFVGHMEIDAEYGRGEKPDMPPELMDLIFEKLQLLNEQTVGTEATNMEPSARFDHYVNILLDKIAAHEGGWDSVNTGKAGDTKVGGDKYNQLFGGKKLSEMTLQEVLDMQAEKQLFAVGRYQFIPTTLNSAVQYTKIDTSSKFDAVTQNKLVRDWLLFGGKRKHLSAYLTGESDDRDEAIQDLCKEWASLPCLNAAGYYDGDSAGNNAIGGKKRLTELEQIITNIHDASIENKQPKKPAKVAESTPTKLPKMVITGDSLSVGMRDSGKVEKIDEQFGIDITAIDAREGRALAAGTDSGRDALRDLSADIKTADIVYLGYGTNSIESNKVFEDILHQSIADIKKQNPNAVIVIPRLYSDITEKDARNKIIDSMVSAENGVFVIDVSASVKLGKDKVHPTDYKAVTEAVMQQVSNIMANQKPVPTTQVQITNPAEQSNPATQETATTAISDTPAGAWISREAAINAYRIFFSSDDFTVDEAGLESWVASLDVNGEGKVFVSPSNLPGNK